jgi:cellulose synthase/poly-beta-1,6-N-acetylglucosamine synthase-like glycosyltransferase
VDNSTANFLTRLQEVEYAMKFTLSKFFQSKIGLMDIISGMGGIFRAEIIRSLGGFDTGLGDDRDLSTMLLKQRFELAFSNDTVVWTTVPEARYHLWRQRVRWRRNIVKIRVSKHRDMFLLGRYGFSNAIIALQLAVRLLMPVTLLIGLCVALYVQGLEASPAVVLTFYWIIVTLLLVRILVTREVASRPKFINFPLIFLYPFYVLWLELPNVYAEWSELFRIGAKHYYVPDHIWEEIPWW